MTNLTPDTFAKDMSDLGPFEARPHIAVGVSGGADSMALAILLQAWAEACEGHVTALIVDHGLRPESGDEAVVTAQRLSDLGIDTCILRWSPSGPSTRLQERARAARYHLMEDWCREHAVLHLAVAHHSDDQAETFLMRLDKGSGPDGLAAMPPVRELRFCRIIRPMLSHPREVVRGIVRDRDIDWIEDPSNQDMRFERVRARRRIQAGEIDVAETARSAQRFRQARKAMEGAASEWLARHASVSPFGFLRFDRRALDAVDAEIRARVLARAVASVGGAAYAPDGDAVDRLWQGIFSGTSRTLSGTLVTPKSDIVEFFRECRNLPDQQRFSAGHHRWDGRFDITVPKDGPAVTICPVGGHIKRLECVPDGVPRAALTGLPMLLSAGGPQLMTPYGPQSDCIGVHFRPITPLYGMGFSVA